MACVYRHIRLDKNVPFYIGIGKSVKRAYSKDRRSVYWNRIVTKSVYRVDIVFDDVDMDFAKQKEKELIALYGRFDLGLGTLCNLTDGGEGTVGFVFTEEERKKRSITALKMSEETKRKMSASAKLKTFSEDHKRNISIAKSNPVLDLETGKIFVSLRDACEFFNENYRKHKGRQEQSCKNIRFKRL